MKTIALSLAALFLTAATWTEGTIIGVPTDNPKRPVVVFANSYTGEGPSAGQWATIDVSEHVPQDTKAVFLSGILILTHGTTAETCNLTTTFRAPGSTHPASDYNGQAVEGAIGNGIRSTMSLWAPVVDGKFEFQWNRNTGGNWPAHCAYGVNLSLQAYAR